MNYAWRAFTVIELMVSVVVIAVLLGILLPALGGAKLNSVELSAMAHQREVGALVRQYGYDRHDIFPFFGIPGTDRAKLFVAADDPFAQIFLPDAPQPLSTELAYWEQSIYWAIHMRFLGYDVAFAGHPPEIEQRNGGEPVPFGTIDFLTWTAYAPPNFFREDSPQLVSDHNVQRWATVAHPSDKVVLQRQNHVREPNSGEFGETLSWFADGHVERLHLRDMGPAVEISGYLFGGGWPGLTTRNGLLGRDR